MRYHFTTATVQSSSSFAPLSSFVICWNIVTTTVNMSYLQQESQLTDLVLAVGNASREAGTHFSHCEGLGPCNRGRMRRLLFLTGCCRRFITSAQIAYKTPLPTAPPLLHVYLLPRNVFTQLLPCKGQCNPVPISTQNLKFSQPWLWEFHIVDCSSVYSV
jgi:hypothetical protein